jgi:parallel beta-helix repeat protein
VPTRAEALELRLLLATFTVSNAADEGPGSLRDAILRANQTAEADTVVFSIPGLGMKVIRPLTPLPALTGPTIIDGTTQPPVPAYPRVEIDGSLAQGADPRWGLQLTGGSTVRGLSVGNWAGGGGAAFRVSGSGNTVEGNWVGVGSDGGATWNDVGVDVEGDANTVSGNRVENNARVGIQVLRSAGTTVRSNAVNNNTGTGVFVTRDSNRTVVEGNVVGGNGGSGIVVDDGCDDALIRLNLIGGRGTPGVAFPDDPAANGNHLDGVSVGANSLRATVDSNVIVHNGRHGLLLERDADLALVIGNTVRANGADGVRLDNGSSTVRIAGNSVTGNAGGGVVADHRSFLTAVEDNTIAFNGGDGVRLRSNAFDQTPAAVLRNSIHHNGGAGIAGSAAPGMIFTSVVSNGGATYVWGALGGLLPLTAHHVELFANDPSGPDGGGPFTSNSVEAERLVRSVDVMTDGRGTATCFAELPGLAPGWFVSATTSGRSGNVYQTSGITVGQAVVTYNTLRVAQVFLKSSKWTAQFLEHLRDAGLGSATYGYAVPNDFLTNRDDYLHPTLPWTNLDTASVAFTEPVTADREDLLLGGPNVPGHHREAFRYDAPVRVGTWTLTPPIVKDRERLRVDASTSKPVTGADGRRLDGELRGGYPSGDGVPGTDFVLPLNFLPGDADRAGERVTAADLAFVRARAGRVAGDTAAGGLPYSARADVNGDGRINVLDVNAVRARLGDGLPPVPASITSATSIATRRIRPARERLAGVVAVEIFGASHQSPQHPGLWCATLGEWRGKFRQGA